LCPEFVEGNPVAETRIESAPTGLDGAPPSLIDGSPTRPWHHIPGDYRRPASPERYDLYWDDANRFGMLHPRAKDPWETLAYYETADEPYYTHLTSPLGGEAHPPGAGGRRSWPLPTRLLIRLAWAQDWGVPLSAWEVDRCCPRRPGRILDIGCGPGNLLAQCRDLGHTVHGVEPDPQPRQAARDRGLEVHAGTCEDLPEPIRDRTFDLIIASHVIHHCIDPVAALRNIADRLAPGGRFLCEVANQECLGARWGGIAWSHLDVPRQANVFTQRSLTRLIERAALRVEEVRWAQYCRQFLPATIEHERRKYDFFKARGSGRGALPVKPTRLSRYGLLACSLFARPGRKYDALRIIASKPEAGG
jgi:SAM-dependent methyltransferase